MSAKCSSSRVDILTQEEGQTGRCMLLCWTSLYIWALLEDTAHIQGGSFFGKSSLETPSQTHPEMRFCSLLGASSSPEAESSSSQVSVN